MSPSTGVVVVAAEPREFAGLLRDSPGVKLNWTVDFARLSRGFVLLANGPGPALSAKAVREASQHTDIRALVSTLSPCRARFLDLAWAAFLAGIIAE